MSGHVRRHTTGTGTGRARSPPLNPIADIQHLIAHPQLVRVKAAVDAAILISPRPTGETMDVTTPDGGSPMALATPSPPHPKMHMRRKTAPKVLSFSTPSPLVEAISTQFNALAEKNVELWNALQESQQMMHAQQREIHRVHFNHEALQAETAELHGEYRRLQAETAERDGEYRKLCEHVEAMKLQQMRTAEHNSKVSSAISQLITAKEKSPRVQPPEPVEKKGAQIADQEPVAAAAAGTHVDHKPTGVPVKPPHDAVQAKVVVDKPAQTVAAAVETTVQGLVDPLDIEEEWEKVVWFMP